MKTVAVIQARLGSTRLPGKVMKRLGGRTVIGHVIHRVQASSRIDEVVVATTTRPGDGAIVDEAYKYGVAVFRGSEEDVLSRYYHAAKERRSDVVVRITADCPLIDPVVIEGMLARFGREREKGRRLDYLSNTLSRTFPRGLDAEVFTFQALERAYTEANEPHEREHVTPYIYLRPDEFALFSYTQASDQSHHRWTLDTREDWRLLQSIFQELGTGEQISTDAVLLLLENRPELLQLNRHIEQKRL